jgi:hypothetical protein
VEVASVLFYQHCNVHLTSGTGPSSKLVQHLQKQVQQIGSITDFASVQQGDSDVLSRRAEFISQIRVKLQNLIYTQLVA